MEFFLLKHADAKSFLDSVETYLLKNESEHNLSLGIATAIASGTFVPESPYYFEIRDKNGLVGTAVRSNPNKALLLSKMPLEAARFLSASLHEQNLSLLELLGPTEVMDAFAEDWMARTSTTAKVLMRQGVYEVDQVLLPAVAGCLLVVTPEHSDMAARFYLEFVRECMPDNKDSSETLRMHVEKHIAKGTLYFWQNSEGALVAMAGKARESRNGATLSMVYTPPELRGRGYGMAVTAALSKKLLLQGKRVCNLYTDLSNSTSNSIYQKVGYKKIGESMHLAFVAP